jgi:hypothetical protein
LVSSFHEPPDENREPRADGWRRIEPPATVRVYLAQGWHDALAVHVNDDTREVRVEWPPRRGGDPFEMVTHRVLSADRYAVSAEGLPRG